MRTITVLTVAISMSITSTFTASAGEWGIGGGIARYQPPQQGAADVFGGGPFVYYQGERLNVGFGATSYALVKSKKLRLAVEGRGRNEGYDPEKSDSLRGMDKRDPAFDVGLSMSSGGLWGEATISIAADVTSTYDGYVVRAIYQVPWQAGRWQLKPTFGISRQSDSLVDYYYGVRQDEARIDRPAYTGQASTNMFLDLSIDYKLTRHWHALGGMEFVHLGNSITSSPIIEKKYKLSTFGALLYRF